MKKIINICYNGDLQIWSILRKGTEYILCITKKEILVNSFVCKIVFVLFLNVCCLWWNSCFLTCSVNCLFWHIWKVYWLGDAYIRITVSHSNNHQVSILRRLKLCLWRFKFKESNIQIFQCKDVQHGTITTVI